MAESDFFEKVEAGGEQAAGSRSTQIKLRLDPRDTQQHVFRITEHLIESQDARHRAEASLAKVLEQLEHLKTRRGVSDPIETGGAGQEVLVLRRELERTRASLRQTQAALVQARDRAEALHSQFGQEQEGRRMIEAELGATQERLAAATEVLKELEDAFVTGQGPGPA